jgi:hypothetical protein
MGATAGHTSRLSSPLSKRRGLAAHAETGFSAVTELAGEWILAGRKLKAFVRVRRQRQQTAGTVQQLPRLSSQKEHP